MSAHFTVRRLSKAISEQDEKAYRKLLSEQGLTTPECEAFSTAHMDMLRSHYPYRVHVWRSRPNAKAFADELQRRTFFDWLVTVDPLDSTAFHESGHAVVAYSLNRPLGTVSIMPSNGSIGRNDFPELKLDDPIAAERAIIVRLAGYGLQAVFELENGQMIDDRPVPNLVQLADGATTNDGGFQGDSIHSFQIAKDFMSDPMAAIRSLAAVTQQIIERPEVIAATKAVAAALLARDSGTLPPEEVYRIIKTCNVATSTPTSRWTPKDLWLQSS